MIALILGLASLLVLMGALGMFSRAQVATLKSMGIWVAAIGGLLLAALLFLTGRGATALAALVMLGPLVWSWVIQPGSPSTPRPDAPRSGPMSRAEAYQVLGLKPGASEAEIRAAHRRLVRGAHPDSGGSDWLAARINQARDILLS
ncbi:DnaJ domain-containing protein [Limobrevibacterium gyesilva]|uniref:DnaJ domain-containing protein n=1 Tax=Limobrevibacterium gyesilva TaxID=2991712 RepID=A0AA41YIG0_9PROT|nr:DnaJ domain-containing protein [Limobrevibacterium gyesilva]MCW3472980.1 DnaJ domain-containing protein [Limobrevibacterium gyesilva]